MPSVEACTRLRKQNAACRKGFRDIQRRAKTLLEENRKCRASYGELKRQSQQQRAELAAEFRLEGARALAGVVTDPLVTDAATWLTGVPRS